MQTTLPNKYYLSHARELFSYIRTHCEPLLNLNHQHYLDRFEALSPSAQCMLIRILARKPQYLKRQSLRYSEIQDYEHALKELYAKGFASNVREDEWHNFAPHLTKPELVACFENTSLNVRNSVSKAKLLDLALGYFSGDEPALFRFRDYWVVRRQQDTVDYLLFLYFGDLRNRFQKFVLRDLGVMKTRGKNSKLTARFLTKNDALSAFSICKVHRDYLNQPQQYRATAMQFIDEHEPSGDTASKSWDKLVMAIGGDLVSNRPDLAVQIWQKSTHPKALEQRVRTLYSTKPSSNDRESLASELKALGASALDPKSKVFLRDFYARKFEGKKTSVYTDMLRESTNLIAVDESYLGAVEEGVIQHYCRQGHAAWFVENKLWRVLFAFTLWPLLYGKEQFQHTEFDFLPAPLRDKNFYSDNQSLIEQQLKLLEDPVRAIKKFARIAAMEYGTPTGIFRWSPTILDMLKPCIKFAPAGSLAIQIRNMAKDYSNTSSGYPDLMVLENGKLRFEEVKAPGDSLRPNQLLSIEQLRDSGLRVEICQVEWAADPMQLYAVVDIETTGGRSGNNSITEIAVVKVQDGAIKEEWSTLINPEKPIPAHITRLTGINNQMVAGAPRFAEIADELEGHLDQAIFVAHNVGFDYGFIKAAYEGIGRRFRKPKFCTVQNSRKTFPRLKSYSLGNLAAEFDIDLQNAHRALDDARATAHLLRLIQQKRLMVS